MFSASERFQIGSKIKIKSSVLLSCNIKCMFYVDLGFHQTSDPSGVLPKVLLVFQDLKLKISEVYDQKWCFPDSAQLAVSAKLRQLTGQSQENTNLSCSLLKF